MRLVQKGKTLPALHNRNPFPRLSGGHFLLCLHLKLPAAHWQLSSHGPKLGQRMRNVYHTKGTHIDCNRWERCIILHKLYQITGKLVFVAESKIPIKRFCKLFHKLNTLNNLAVFVHWTLGDHPRHFSFVVYLLSHCLYLIYMRQNVDWRRPFPQLQLHSTVPLSLT